LAGWSPRLTATCCVDEGAQAINIDPATVGDALEILIAHEINGVFGDDVDGSLRRSGPTFGCRQVRGLEDPLESELEVGPRRGDRFAQRLGITLRHLTRVGTFRHLDDCDLDFVLTLPLVNRGRGVLTG
jgi:hypothetical protein